MYPKAQEELRLLEEKLQESDVMIGPKLKKRVYEILLEIRCEGQNSDDMPGMLVILGYSHNYFYNGLYYSEADKNQNIFKNGPWPYIMTEEAKERIRSTKDFDGAILIDPNGYVTDSGIYLRNIDPVAVLEKIGVENDRDLSSRFGFIDKVHARHLIGISASYVIPATTTYTLSKESGIIRVFEQGRILFSQLEEEIFAYKQQCLIHTPRF